MRLRVLNDKIYSVKSGDSPYCQNPGRHSIIENMKTKGAIFEKKYKSDFNYACRKLATLRRTLSTLDRPGAGKFNITRGSDTKNRTRNGESHRQTN